MSTLAAQPLGSGVADCLTGSVVVDGLLGFFRVCPQYGEGEGRQPATIIKKSLFLSGDCGGGAPHILSSRYTTTHSHAVSVGRSVGNRQQHSLWSIVRRQTRTRAVEEEKVFLEFLSGQR